MRRLLIAFAALFALTLGLPALADDAPQSVAQNSENLIRQEMPDVKLLAHFGYAQRFNKYAAEDLGYGRHPLAVYLFGWRQTVWPNISPRQWRHNRSHRSVLATSAHFLKVRYRGPWYEAAVLRHGLEHRIFFIRWASRRYGEMWVATDSGTLVRTVRNYRGHSYIAHNDRFRRLFEEVRDKIAFLATLPFPSYTQDHFVSTGSWQPPKYPKAIASRRKQE